MDGCLVNLPNSIYLLGGFLQENQIEPGIVIERVFSDLIFVKISSLAQDNLVDFFLRAVLLLKIDVHFV